MRGVLPVFAIVVLSACGATDAPGIANGDSDDDAAAADLDVPNSHVDDPEPLAELADPTGVGAIFAPTEHVLDPLLLARDDFPAGWTVEVDDSYSGEDGESGCPASFAFAEFLDWMEREVVATNGETVQVVHGAGIWPYEADPFTTLDEVGGFGDCTLDDDDVLSVSRTTPPPTPRAKAITALRWELAEGRADWYGVVLGDGVVMSLTVIAAHGEPESGEQLLDLALARIPNAFARIEGCTETRLLLTEGQLPEAPTPLEVCGGWDDWHREHRIAPALELGR